MSAEIVTVADAVVYEMNVSGRWSQPFEAERKWLPVLELEEAGENVLVTVVPATQAGEQADRATDWIDYTVVVQVQKRLQENTDDVIAASVEDQCDEIVLLVEEMADWWRQSGSRPLTQYTAAWMQQQPVIDPVIDQAVLNERREISSALGLTFRVRRARQ